MIDFKAALEEGFDAAQRAADERKEIEEVFKQLDEQIRKATDGKLSIRKGLREVDLSSMPKLAVSALAQRFSYPPQPQEKYWAIFASNPTMPERKAIPLASWSQDGAGYPCLVSWGEEEHFCEDKEGLSNCLADLLRDPEVAESLIRVMKWRTAEKATSDTATYGAIQPGVDNTAGQDVVSEAPEAPTA